MIAGLFLLATFAHADDWVSPTPRTLTSADGTRTAVITPSKGGARVEIRGGEKPVAFDMKFVPVDAVVFDDGRLLVLDQWHQLGMDKVATLLGSDGKAKWTKTLVQLIGKGTVERARHSVSSIWWRKVPLEWDLAQDGKTGTITLFDENKLRLTIANGSTELVAVPDLPADAERLLNRARFLSEEPARHTEAIALLDRVIAMNPEQLEAIGIQVDLFQAAGDHAKVIALLDRVSPKWKAKTTDVANVCIQWAKSLTALGRLPEAEQKLRLGIDAAPTYSNPAVELSRLLLKNKRVKEADTVLDELVARLLAASYLDTFTLAQVAEYYERERGESQKALAIYLKGYKKTEVTNQFLYAELAELHDKLGNTAQAIAVQEQLLAHFTKMGSAFDDYAKRTREALARLRAKSKQKP